MLQYESYICKFLHWQRKILMPCRYQFNISSYYALSKRTYQLGRKLRVGFSYCISRKNLLMAAILSIAELEMDLLCIIIQYYMEMSLKVTFLDIAYYITYA